MLMRPTPFPCPALAVDHCAQRLQQCPHRLACPPQVVTVPEDCGTADALRAVAPRITSSHFIVLSEDVVTDIPVNALLASHQMHGALTTVTLVPCKTSPSSETKPGKAPKVRPGSWVD
eukprot:354212-Chlamydomonas_euryale.AAC.1